MGEDPQAASAAEPLRKAADHVMVAQTEMEAAVGFLSAPADLDAARGAQDFAIQEIATALSILEPPKEGAQGDDSEQPDGQGEEQQQRADTPEAAPQQEPPQQEAGLGTDPGQLLQGVRDREAKRRRARANRQSGYESVEKDW